MKHTEKPAVEPEPSWEEFRRYSRRDIDVRIKIALNNNGVQTYVYGRGNDIAEGGMAAYISMEMSIGSRIKLEVQLPYSQQPLKIGATVPIWSCILSSSEPLAVAERMACFGVMPYFTINGNSIAGSMFQSNPPTSVPKAIFTPCCTALRKVFSWTLTIAGQKPPRPCATYSPT